MTLVLKWIAILFIPLCGICVPAFYFFSLDGPIWVWLLELFFIPVGIMWIVGHYESYFT